MAPERRPRVDRKDRGYLPVDDRRGHYREVAVPLPAGEVALQGSRCLDCGTRCAGRFDGPPGEWGPRRLPIRVSDPMY